MYIFYEYIFKYYYFCYICNFSFHCTLNNDKSNINITRQTALKFSKKYIVYIF